jgi:uncharacterized protein
VSSSAWREVGVVSRIFRYPLKGAGGEDLDQSRIGWHGVAGDRHFAFLRHSEPSGLPWVSPREFPAVVAWQVTSPQPGHLRIKLPDSTVWEVSANDTEARDKFSAFVSDLLGEPVSLVQLWRGAFDSMPISVISGSTVADVATLSADGDIDIRRFRANLVVDLNDDRPGAEQKWLGNELRLGGRPDSPVLRLDRTTTRCEVIDVHPDTGVRDQDLFRRIREERRNRVGVYASVGHPGTASVGDVVVIR